MKMQTNAKLGLVGLVSLGSAGCMCQEEIGTPPIVVAQVDETPGKNWKKEGDYWYKKEIIVKGKMYCPRNLNEALRLNEKLREEYNNNNQRILKKGGRFPRFYN